MQVLAQTEYQRGPLHSWRLSSSLHLYLIHPSLAIFAASVWATSVSHHSLQYRFCLLRRSDNVTNSSMCSRWARLPQGSCTTRESSALDRGQIEFARSPPTLCLHGSENLWEVWRAAYCERTERRWHRRGLIHWIYRKTRAVVYYSSHEIMLAEVRGFIITNLEGPVMFFK